MSCTVWGCNNTNPTTADPSVHYYVFPKHPLIAQQWVNACGWPPEEIDTNLARICSIHFSEDSYTTEVKLIEYITCYTKVLKFDAVPTLYLPITSQLVLKSSDPHDELREMIVFTSEAPNQQETGQQITKKEYGQLKPTSEKVTPEEAEKYKHVQTKEQLACLQNCNKNLRDKIFKMAASYKRLKDTIAKQMEMYKMKDLELSNLHQEYLRSKRVFLSFQQQKTLLSKVFSESQIKILSGKKKIYWSNDDMAVGYTIRHLSNKRCYMYLTKKLNVPLPAVSSIKRWMTVKGTNQRRDLRDKPEKAEAEDEESE